MVPGKFSSKSRGRSETPLQLSQTFFKPADMKKTGFMDGLVRGMAEQGSKLWDNSFVEDIRYNELYIAWFLMLMASLFVETICLNLDLDEEDLTS